MIWKGQSAAVLDLSSLHKDQAYYFSPQEELDAWDISSPVKLAANRTNLEAHLLVYFAS